LANLTEIPTGCVLLELALVVDVPGVLDGSRSVFAQVQDDLSGRLLVHDPRPEFATIASMRLTTAPLD
jgi:hypothetical protein